MPPILPNEVFSSLLSQLEVFSPRLLRHRRIEKPTTARSPSVPTPGPTSEIGLREPRHSPKVGAPVSMRSNFKQLVKLLDLADHSGAIVKRVRSTMRFFLSMACTLADTSITSTTTPAGLSPFSDHAATSPALAFGFCPFFPRNRRLLFF